MARRAKTLAELNAIEALMGALGAIPTSEQHFLRDVAAHSTIDDASAKGIVALIRKRQGCIDNAAWHLDALLNGPT